MRRLQRIAATAAMVVLAASLFLLAPPPLAHATGAPFEFRQVKPDLQIEIPNLRFSDVRVNRTDGRTDVVSIPWIGEYIAAIYRWAVPVGAILATIVIMAAGVVWLTSGGAQRLSTARDWITNAVIGLLLVVGSYVVLNIVNPDLVRLRALEVQIVKPIEFEPSGDTDAPISFTPQDAATLGFHCPRSGGVAEIPKVINSMRGKVAYRFGGKGRPPPYSETPGGSFLEFNTNCPAGNMCLDCSGFINYVLTCAGAPAPGGGTGSIFSGAEAIRDIDLKNNRVNDVALKPGDLLGWKTNEGGHAIGHVIMYIGGGQVAESKGGRAGRQPNANPVIRPLAGLGRSYTFKWVRRL